MPLPPPALACVRNGPRLLALATGAALLGCSVPPPAGPPPAPPAPSTAAPAVPVAPVAATKTPPALRPPDWLAGRKTLLMHYMPWYETPAVRGFWGSHWKGPQGQHQPDRLDAEGKPDIWSHYHPLIGLYDSSDPHAVECHLLQMKTAGINGVVVDWYGLADQADHPQIHRATQVMFDWAAACGMTFAACYEDRAVKLLVDWRTLPPIQTTNHLRQTIAWMQEHWFAEPQYHRVQGRPLLLNFGPIFFAQPAAWQEGMAGLPVRPLFFALHHLWRSAGADGGFTWVHYDPWEGSPDERQIRTRIGEVFSYASTEPREVIVSAYPGFNDVYTHERHRELDHRGGRTLRETLQVAMQGPWPMIQLVTWNDYGEGTMIEPTQEFGYQFLEIIQEMRRLEIGPAFPYSTEDLQLPARLYALRKAGHADPAALDRAARLLVAGQGEAAARELGKLEQVKDGS